MNEMEMALRSQKWSKQPYTDEKEISAKMSYPNL